MDIFGRSRKEHGHSPLKNTMVCLCLTIALFGQRPEVLRFSLQRKVISAP